jgi:hypothetical protein
MPFVLLAIGAVFLVAGVRGTHADYTVGGTSYPGLFTLIKGDFSGNANFLYWFAAIFLIGCIGYVQKLKAVSDAFILLVIVAMFVAKSKDGSVSGGFFQKFIDALKTPALAAPDSTSNDKTAVFGTLPSAFSNPLPTTDSATGSVINYPFPDSSL